MHGSQQLREDTLMVKIPPQVCAVPLNLNTTAKQPSRKAAGLVEEARRFCGRAGSRLCNR